MRKPNPDAEEGSEYHFACISYNRSYHLLNFDGFTCKLGKTGNLDGYWIVVYFLYGKEIVF
jgi:hypothetical protein